MKKEAAELNYKYSLAKGELRVKAIELHHKRYEEVGYFSKNETDHYEKYAEYFVVQTENLDEVVGITRLIYTKLEELPTMKNFQIYDIERARMQQLDKSRYAEISAFTKMQQHDVGLGLIRMMFQYSFSHGLTHLVCCVDERVYRYMVRAFNFPYKVIGEPKVYLGSTTIPCVINLAEGIASLKESRPKLYEYLVDYEASIIEVCQ